MVTVDLTTMNKNTRLLARLKHTAIRNKEHEIKFQVPVANYHSNGQTDPAKSVRPKTLEVSFGAGVVSQAPSRNMQMRVLHNTGEDRKKSSLTVHEPINRSNFVRFKGHKYVADDPAKEISYFQTAK